MAHMSDDLDSALALHRAGRLQAAEAVYRRILALDPYHAEALHLLGLIAHQTGRHEAAVELLQSAIRLQGTRAEFHSNLAIVLQKQGRLAEALDSFQATLQLQPDHAGAYLGMAHALHQRGQLDEAVRCYERVLQMEPSSAEAHNNLGTILQAQGRLADAIACYRRALELQPTAAWVHSNLLYTLNYCPDYDAQALLEEHRRWDRQHARPLTHFIRPHNNDRTPERRLRIGYVSPDFSFQPVGWFMAPLLEAHDHSKYEIFCFSSVSCPDQITHRCRAHADAWRDVHDLSDAQLADAIRQERIDILVDLTMHAAGSRLLVFARKPAPVQATYLAYCGTTGLGAMDYRLTDPYLDPPGAAAPPYSEKSIWLPKTYWCYRPPLETPDVNALPALEARHVTFGCLNHFSKVSAPTLDAWSRLLNELPESRLLLHARDESHRARIRAYLGSRAILPERVRFVNKLALLEYLKTHGCIDVALDPFPYGGGTTTCDALWMGVPVVSLAGTTAVGRAGLSILSNVGLSDLVARTAEQYVQLATELAGDLPRLRALRAGLRGRLQASPLMDAPNFARAVEAAFREMWRRWCAEGKRS